MNIKLALIGVITPRRLRLIRRHGRFDRAGFMRCSRPDHIEDASGPPLFRFNFKDSPQAYLDHWRSAHDWSEQLINSPRFAALIQPHLSLFDLPRSHLINTLKKELSAILSDDCQLLSLGERLFAGSPRTYYVEQPSLLAFLAEPAGAQLASAASPWQGRALYAAHVLRLAWEILRPAQAPVRLSGRPAFIFDQRYAGYGTDAEFLAFHRYFRSRSDVVYNCTSRTSEKFIRLRDEGAPVAAHGCEVPGLRAKSKALLRLLRLVIASAKDRRLPWSFKFVFIRILRRQLYCEALFSRYRPRFYLKVRADLDANHPVTTAVAERYGVRNVGYSCGSYPFFCHFYSIIDFHDYGLLGRHFHERTFAGVWPDAIRYRILGPFTGELHDPAPPRPAPPAGKPVIAAFPTTGADDFYIGEDFYRGFVAAAATTAGQLGAKLLFKEKNAEAQPELLTHIARHCAGLCDYELVHKSDAQKVMESADLILVMGGSTTAWEALGQGRRVLIFEQPWLNHPFEEYAPSLVIKDASGLAAAATRLLAMPRSEYTDMIRPALDRCCARSDGRLVRNFIESMEHEG